MNIRSLISNIFSGSSQKKDNNDQSAADKISQDHVQITLSNKSESEQSEEDLLSNLRKSKLFLDDFELQKSSPNQRLAAIEETNDSIGFGNVANDSMSSKFYSAVGDLQCHQSSIAISNQRSLMEKEKVTITPNLAEFLDSLKKATVPVLHLAEGDPIQQKNCIFFDRQNSKYIEEGTSKRESPQIRLRSDEMLVEEVPLKNDNLNVKQYEFPIEQQEPEIEVNICTTEVDGLDYQVSEDLFMSDEEQLSTQNKQSSKLCLSTRAQPPTQTKERLDSFNLEESVSKLKIQVSKINWNSCASTSPKKMSVDNPVLTYESIDVGDQDNFGMVAGNNGLNSSARKCLSNEQSPDRACLGGFHKQIEMMIDKSESLPNYLTKSANKVPSPIKEVEECSQRNFKTTPSRDMEILDEVGIGAATPKQKQKSVKFDGIVTPCDHSYDSNCEGKLLGSSEERHSKAYEKLQSRKPTPYNPHKQNYGLRPNNEGTELSELDKMNDVMSVVQPATIISSHNGRLFRNEKESLLFELNRQENMDQVMTVTEISKEKVDNKLKGKLPQDVNRNVCVRQADKLDAIQEQRDEVSKGFFRRDLKQPLSCDPKIRQIQGEGTSKFGRITTFHETIIDRLNDSSGTSKCLKYQGLNILKRINNNNKKKVNDDEHAIFNQFNKVATKKSAGVEQLSTQSNPLPRPMRSTVLSNIGQFNAKTTFKNCVICSMEVKTREESKVFPCCHRIHLICLPKEKNSKCPRCNQYSY